MIQKLALIDKLSEGIEIGRKQGIEIGHKQFIAETVKNLSLQGKSVSEIVEIMLSINNLSVPKDEIESILEDQTK